LAGNAWALKEEGDGQAVLTAALDRDSAPVGGIVELVLKVRLPEGARLSDSPEIGGLENLHVLKRSRKAGRIRIRLLVDRLGSWRSGPLQLSYVDGEGHRQSVKTGPVSLTVLSILGEKPAEARLRPIRDIVPIRSPWLKILPWAAGAAVLVLGAALLFQRLKSRKTRDRINEISDPPHLRAVRELETLAGSGLFEKGEVKSFYFLFSEVLRRYLESLRHFPAAEYTTEEIARALEHPQDRKLLPLLRQADLVKFADSIPTVARKEEDLQAAMTTIRETGPAPETGRKASGDQGAPT
jgi:hypothetical protein